MRYSAFILLVLVCLNAVQSVSLRKNDDNAKLIFAIERLRFLGKQSPVNQQIVNAIEMHLSQGGQVTEIFDLIVAAIEDVSAQKASLVSEYYEKVAQLTDTIQTTSISKFQNEGELSSINLVILSLQQEISGLEQYIQFLIDIQYQLSLRTAYIEQARSIDEAAYASRKARDENSLSVLPIIIAKLRALESRGPVFLQSSMKDIKKALKRIPKSNPIQALVLLATKFNAETLSGVITKLEAIQTAIQASYDQDRLAEVASTAHYDELIAQQNLYDAQITSELINAQSLIITKQGELVSAQGQRDSLVTIIAFQTTLINSTQEELQSTQISYEARIAEATEAINAITQALNILIEEFELLYNQEYTSDLIESWAAGF